jgi:hypothetical protein
LVRTSLFELEPTFKSRVVLDLERMVEIRVAQQGNTINVIISEDVEIPAVPPAVPEKPAELAQVQQPITEPAQPIAPTAEPAKGEEVGEVAGLRKQLDLQKESYAQLKESSDEAERKLKADLEESARQAKKAIEAQRTAVAELKERPRRKSFQHSLPKPRRSRRRHAAGKPSRGSP